MRNWVFCLLLFVAGFAVAEDIPTATYESKGGGKVKVFNFDEDIIEGDLNRPDSEYIDAVVRSKHSNLIKVREDYREKIMQSAGEL
ncbi:MAG: hypothetical protein FWG75_03470 [Cystobacterineae bacterium]|nr:hypothetical protein [Cystobacterineae bacterium]